MIQVITKTIDRMIAVKKAEEKAVRDRLGHGAASIRKTARASIERAPKELRTGGRSKGGVKVRRARHRPSPAGTPPYTQRGQLPNAIVYDVDVRSRSAVVGPRRSVVGESAKAHEFGGRYKDQTYPERPFMHPALVEVAPRFAGEWAGSIGE